MIVNSHELSDDRISASLGPYGYLPSAEDCEKIRTYVELLLRWNKRVSLTALTDIPAILENHFGESIFACSAIPIKNGRLADVGTGAGFPGIPIKIAQPGLDVLLIEPNVKKCAFLAEVARALEIDVQVIRSRMKTAFADQKPVDYMTSRAVGNWDDILKLNAHLATNGKLVLWVGERAISELTSKTAQGLLWSEQIKIPRSIKRFLLVGTKE